MHLISYLGKKENKKRKEKEMYVLFILLFFSNLERIKKRFAKNNVFTRKFQNYYFHLLIYKWTKKNPKFHSVYNFTLNAFL